MPSYHRDPAAPTPNVPRKTGVIALIERDARILVQRRSDDGAWDLLGGMLEEEETVLDALAREIREESGLEIARASLFGLFSDPTRIIEYPDGTVCRLLSIVFHVAPAPGDVPSSSDESLELSFVDRDELAALDLWPAVRPVVDAFLAQPTDVLVS